MNCKGFRKYVGAFADGELELQQNLEALEHLNMCPQCATRVSNVTNLKAALSEAYAEIQVPAPLQARIAAITNVSVAQEEITAQSISVRRWFSALSVPLAMAASIVIFMFAWSYIPGQEPRPGTITVVTGRFVQEVQEQHVRCATQRGTAHHDDRLPHDLDGIAKALAMALDLDVVAPDLSTYGFDLIGGDRCGVRGRPGAHLLYQDRHTGLKLSVFTLGLVPSLGPNVVGGQVPRQYFVSSSRDLSVVGWHHAANTYLVCADLPQEKLIQMAGEVRFAMNRPSVRIPAIASATLIDE